ncbi:MAG: M42 family metallopeptidase [Candidatus Cloacimonetes bacterium]|nr:M42 family metallopeptidase [Candidatus Cloacimonadota bacterium]
MERLELIEKLTKASGISGYESPIREIMIEELGKLTDYETDKMGSIHFLFKGKENAPKILCLAHQDEVGFIVADILHDGFLKMQAIGGWDVNTLLSSPLEVINKKGEKFPGIIGSIPVHFLKDTQQKLNIESLFVDIGAIDREDVMKNFGIQLGDQIVPVTNYHYSSKNKRIFSKAFDDRIGITSVIELGKRLANREMNNSVYCSGSVQEEVGTRGARVIANYIQADLAIILEGAPADDIPGLPGNSQTAVGKGVHIRLFDPTMIVKSSLKNFIVETAEKNSIPYQLTVRRRGGTDGMQIHTANYGIPTIVMGVPVRYAHSHNGMISLDDFDNLVNLLEQVVLNYKA